MLKTFTLLHLLGISLETDFIVPWDALFCRDRDISLEGGCPGVKNYRRPIWGGVIG